MLSGHDWNFIHIPKCGGMALRHHLTGKEVGDKMPLGKLCAIRSPLHRIPVGRPAGQVFTIVRHPAAWLRSYWLDQSPKRVGKKRFLHHFWSNNLDQFVENVCTEYPGYVGELYRAHTPYHTIKVFRLEDGLAPVFAWLNIQVKKILVVNGSPASPVLSDQSLKLIARVENKTLKQFGYAA